MKPQIYIYVDSEGNSDHYVTRGEIEVIQLNWETLKNANDNMLEATDFLEARAKIKAIALVDLRRQELGGLRDFLAEYNQERHQQEEWNRQHKEAELDRARAHVARLEAELKS